MQPDGILETCLYAADLTAAEQFYVSVMGLELVGREAGRHVFFRCGRSVLLVFNPAHTASVETFVGGKPIPLHGATGPGHAAFAIGEAELPRWRERLAAAGVAIESEIAWPGGGKSIYFRDPAGNSLELATPSLWALPGEF